jgi:hypothetical protein
MKITYFDPNSLSVNISGTNYQYFPNNFNSSNCAALVPSNDPIASTGPASMVYVRDARNKQVYKVKRMIDNKCWMIDDLKYAGPTDSTGATIANGDGSTGLIFNNQPGVTNMIGSGQAAANRDIAFYNNLMADPICYGGSTSVMSANTLTHCAYKYNYYAATGGTGSVNISVTDLNATGSICPANFRLPSATSDGVTPMGTGSLPNVADFPVLNASMAAGTLATGNTVSTPATWQPSGAWASTFSGGRQGSSFYIGQHAYYWTATSDIISGGGIGNPLIAARTAYFSSTLASPGSSVIGTDSGLSVRCLVE